MTADSNNIEESCDKLRSSDEIASSQVHIMEDSAQQLKAFIIQNPNIFGAADIYNIRFQSPLTLAGMLTAVLTGLVDTDRRPAVHKYLVILPPGLKAEECEEKVWSIIAPTFRLFAQREMEPCYQVWLKSHFHLVIAPDRRTSSILDIIKAQPEFTSITVVDAASYRDDGVALYIAPGASSPLRPEDVWAPQLRALATAAIKLAKTSKLYVALDANQLSPGRKVLSDLLLSIEGCGVLGSSSENSPDSILATKVDQWDAWLQEGSLGKVFREIDQLPANLDRQKPYLRIQILHKAGHFPQALEAIRSEITRGLALDASMRVKFAKFAQDANASRFAAEILSPAVGELRNREDLESALVTAHDADSIELEEKIAERLNTLFPGSPGVRQRRLRTFFANRDYRGAAMLMADEPGGQAEFYCNIARFLSGDDAPDYNGLIALAGSDISQADAYRIACVNDALSRKLVSKAFELALALPSTLAQRKRGELLLLRVMEQFLLLNGKDGALPVESELFQTAILSLIARLAANPENHALRAGLSHIFQRFSGILGCTSLLGRPSRMVVKFFNTWDTMKLTPTG